MSKVEGLFGPVSYRHEEQLPYSLNITAIYEKRRWTNSSFGGFQRDVMLLPYVLEVLSQSGLSDTDCIASKAYNKLTYGSAARATYNLH